jgi:glycosyltransferase involved in cell wall biosynthesis
MKKVTILIPCYNEEGSLDALYEALKELMDTQTSYTWEILMVNDGSKDRTIDIIKQLREKDKRICYVNLSRNFGKENAMLAGFDYATGDCMVIMDADLQHPPMTISDMLAKWEEGYEDVYAKRITRGKESWFRKQFSLFYYRMLKHLTRVEILENVGDFRLLDRKCIDALKNLRETQRYTKGMYCWIGFRKTEVWFEQGDRLAGESSFNFLRLLNLAIDGITSFTTAPLRIATIMGLFVSLIAFVFMCYILLTTLIWGDPVQGYPTLITVILFLGGLQLLSLGIIGEYLGRIFYETKGRPVYVVSEVEGVE